MEFSLTRADVAYGDVAHVVYQTLDGTQQKRLTGTVEEIHTPPWNKSQVSELVLDSELGRTAVNLSTTEAVEKIIGNDTEEIGTVVGISITPS